MKLITITYVALAGAPCVTGFVSSNHGKKILYASPISLSSTNADNFVDESESAEPLQQQTTQKRRPRGPVMSQAIPILECPPILVDSDLAGNYGFDPLRLSTTKEQLWEYREAEVKHGRLAMLVRIVFVRFYVGNTYLSIFHKVISFSW